MKFAVFGAGGLVGWHLCISLEKNGHEVLKLGRSSAGLNYLFDASDKHACENFFKETTPEVVVNCIKSNFSTDVSERKKEITWKANVIAAENIAKMCRKYSSKLVHMSSAWVYEGKEGEIYREESITYPVNFYSYTKAIAEERVIANTKEAILLRADSIFGYDKNNRNFFSRLKQAMEKGIASNAPIDQYAQPICAEEIARLIPLLISKGASGIYNCVGPDYLSRYDLALIFCKHFGWDASLVTKISSSSRKIRIPTHLNVDISKISKIEPVKPINDQINDLKRCLNDCIYS